MHIFCCMQLIEGAAEIFGCELSLQQQVTIKGQTLAVFSWEGCRLRVEGTPELM
jgi:polyribonucleotide 5'-hydroxyl-kinase